MLTSQGETIHLAVDSVTDTHLQYNGPSITVAPTFSLGGYTEYKATLNEAYYTKYDTKTGKGLLYIVCYKDGRKTESSIVNNIIIHEAISAKTSSIIGKNDGDTIVLYDKSKARLSQFEAMQAYNARMSNDQATLQMYYNKMNRGYCSIEYCKAVNHWIEQAFCGEFLSEEVRYEIACSYSKKQGGAAKAKARYLLQSLGDFKDAKQRLATIESDIAKMKKYKIFDQTFLDKGLFDEYLFGCLMLGVGIVLTFIGAIFFLASFEGYRDTSNRFLISVVFLPIGIYMWVKGSKRRNKAMRENDASVL